MMAPPRMGNILYRPVLVVTCPATIEVTVTPSIIGVSIRPLTVGDAPCTVCWYSGRNVIAPNMARPVRKVIAIDEGEVPVAEDVQRQHRLGGPRLGDAERDGGRHGRAGRAR